MIPMRKKFITLLIFSWVVSFLRDYDTGLWFWEASHIGWEWDYPTFATRKRFRTKTEALVDWKLWLLSGTDDREWKEKP